MSLLTHDLTPVVKSLGQEAGPVPAGFEVLKAAGTGSPS